eukprot:ANDGO_03779.mRNA.1 hypothetical protein
MLRSIRSATNPFSAPRSLFIVFAVVLGIVFLNDSRIISNLEAQLERVSNVRPVKCKACPVQSCSKKEDEKECPLCVCEGCLDQTQASSSAACPKPAKGTPSRMNQVGTVPVLPVVIFAYNRGEDLRRTLNQVFKYLPEDGSYDVFVSQDGFDESVKKVASEFASVTLWQHPHELDHVVPPGESQSYHHIAQNYRRGLTKVFEHDAGYDAVIILEDDLLVAPDFFEYMRAMLPVMQNDDSILCTSAFNDNGKQEHVKDPMALYRSDFFPGLGWMMTRELWDELGPIWCKPNGGYWDDWLREPDHRKQRSCIRPEISRTKTFGKEGTSAGQFFDTHLDKIVLNEVPILWKAVDLAYLEKDRYDSRMDKELASVKVVSADQIRQDNERLPARVAVEYRTIPEFKTIASALGVMADEKASVPRLAYRGVVTIRFMDHLVYIRPAAGVAVYEYE